MASPVKLGEYFAAGTAVVASGIPALRDWLTEERVWFFKPDDAVDLARVISNVIADPQLAQVKCAAGQEMAVDWTYENRVRQIIETLGQ